MQIQRQFYAAGVGGLLLALALSGSWILAGKAAGQELTATATTAPTQQATASRYPASQPVDPTRYLTGDWFGLRQKLANRGIGFDIDYTADGTRNLRDGLDTAGSTWRRLFEATVSVDTKLAFGLEGGTVFVDFQDARGPNASDRLIGDLQGIDGLDGVPGAPHQNRTQLAQLWYQQIAFDGALRIKLGKVDANSEFDRSTAATEFLHQSTGSSATLFTLPTYPDPATGINVFIKPEKDLQFGCAVYDGSIAEGIRTGELGPRFKGANDLFFVAEVDKSWIVGPDQLAGRLGVGGWYSTNKFRRLDGRKISGTGAPYALLDQVAWRANPKDDRDTRAISVFAMYGYGDPDILPYDHNIGGGVAWTAPIPTRSADVVGIGVQSIHFSDAFHPRHPFETSYELFYRVQLTPWFSIKPDFQYISHPGGGPTSDALALTIRFQAAF